MVRFHANQIADSKGSAYEYALSGDRSRRLFQDILNNRLTTILIVFLLQERARSRRFKLVSKDGDFAVEKETIPAAAPQQFVRRLDFFPTAAHFCANLHYGTECKTPWNTLRATKSALKYIAKIRANDVEH